MEPVNNEDQLYTLSLELGPRRAGSVFPLKYHVPLVKHLSSGPEHEGTRPGDG